VCRNVLVEENKVIENEEHQFLRREDEGETIPEEWFDERGGEW
jgi:hypothetical protein